MGLELMGREYAWIDSIDFWACVRLLCSRRIFIGLLILAYRDLFGERAVVWLCTVHARTHNTTYGRMVQGECGSFRVCSVAVFDLWLHAATMYVARSRNGSCTRALVSDKILDDFCRFAARGCLCIDGLAFAWRETVLASLFRDAALMAVAILFMINAVYEMHSEALEVGECVNVFFLWRLRTTSVQRF